MLRFSCFKCGDCCRHLVELRDKELYLGLFLFPNEAKYLERISHRSGIKLNIFPQQGVTTKNRSYKKPNKIISYQLEDSVVHFMMKIQ
jgi:hypothetical protein